MGWTNQVAVIEIPVLIEMKRFVLSPENIAGGRMRKRLTIVSSRPAETFRELLAVNSGLDLSSPQILADMT